MDEQAGLGFEGGCSRPRRSMRTSALIDLCRHRDYAEQCRDRPGGQGLGMMSSRVAGEPDELILQPAGLVGVGQPGDHPLAVANRTRWLAWQARLPSRMARWVLPVPGDPSKTMFSFATSRECLVHDHVARQTSGVVEVEGLRALPGWEPRGPDPAFDAVGAAGGDLTLHAATRYSSCVHDSAQARSAGRSTDSRRVGAVYARVS